MQTSKLNILYIEPFYTGSHKKWIDAYKKYSKHNIQILGLPGKNGNGECMVERLR